MRYLLSSIILFGFLIQTNFTYVGAAEESSIPGGLNIQTNFCTSTWINEINAEGIRNEANMNGVFEINRPCNSVTRNTPLQLAVIGGAPLDKIQAFVESGANVLATNVDGDDAFLLAQRYSPSDVSSYIWSEVIKTEEFKNSRFK